MHYMGASPALLQGATGAPLGRHRRREGSVAQDEAGAGSGSVAITMAYVRVSPLTIDTLGPGDDDQEPDRA